MLILPQEYQLVHNLLKLSEIPPPALFLGSFPQRDPVVQISSACKVTPKPLVLWGMNITLVMRYFIQVQDLRDKYELRLRGKSLRKPVILHSWAPSLK